MTWISVEEKSPRYPADIVIAKRSNGTEVKCFYHADGVSWLQFYGKRAGCWQNYETLEFLDDVTHWMPCPKHTEEYDIPSSD